MDKIVSLGMIKSEELRIGNWVIYATMWQQVYSIGKTAINIAQEPLKINMIKPIPLTEEILLKCGAYRGNGRIKGLWIDFNKEISLRFNDEKLAVFVGNWETERYMYLHQLQNLYFALTGQELQFKP